MYRQEGKINVVQCHKGIDHSILYMYMLVNKEKKEFFHKRIKQNLDILKKEKYIWVHCSSVGEVNLSEALSEKDTF